MPPTALATTGRPHAIASSGTIPNGSYQGTHTTASAERSSAGTSGRATAPSRRTRSATPAAAAACRSRRASGSRSQRGTVLAGAVRAAGDQQLDPRQPAQRRDDLVDALAPDEAAQHDQPGPLGARVHRAVRRERGRVDPARHHGGPPARRAEPGELEDLVGAGGDDPVDPAGDGPLGGDPAGRAGVVGALVAALDAAEGVEGLHDGQVQRSGRGHRGHARHPEVRVHDVRPLRAPSRASSARANAGR